MEQENHTGRSTMAIEIGHHAEFVVPRGTERERGINDREHHPLQAIATFLAGLHGAAPGVPIGTGDQIGLVTTAARVGDVGIAVASGCEAQLGGLHLQHEGAPGGPHHAIPQPRDGMIASTVHARPAETSITGISGEPCLSVFFSHHPPSSQRQPKWSLSIDTYHHVGWLGEDHDRHSIATDATVLGLRSVALPH